MVPTVELPPATPLTLQVTPRFCESLETVALNCWVVETLSDAEEGDTETLMGAVTVMVAVAFLEESAMEVAVRVTVAGAGTLEGAL